MSCCSHSLDDESYDSSLSSSNNNNINISNYSSNLIDDNNTVKFDESSELGEVYRQIRLKVDKGETSLELLPALEFCTQKVYSEGLISKNEELDDYSTGSIQYLYIDYFKGKCYSSVSDLDKRYDALQKAIQYFLSFLIQGRELGQLHESEKKFLECIEEKKPVPSDIKRVFKIEKLRREKETTSRINSLRQVLRVARRDASKSSTTIDYEEEERELSILLLQNYYRLALDEINLAYEELPMLEMRKNLIQQEQYSNPNSSSSTSKPPNFMPSLPPLSEEEQRRLNSGINVTKTSLVDGKLVTEKEIIKAGVFGMGIAPPTISLEEFAEMELADVRRREENEKNAEPGRRKMKQLIADGEEDNEELVDIATIEDRNWDLFKEENPRGWGNKMGKRY